VTLDWSMPIGMGVDLRSMQVSAFHDDVWVIVTVTDGRVGDGELMLIATDGLGGAVRRLQPDAIASFVGRARTKSSDLSSLTNDAATWARGKSSDIAQDDIVVIGVERVSHPVTR